MLRFHIDYFKGDAAQGGDDSKAKAKPDAATARQAVVDAILEKHNAATNQRRFNAVLATASINDAIAYYSLFQQVQARRREADPEFSPLNIACVFSPPAEGNRDVKQLQEDLSREKADNEQEPELKKAALKQIIVDYNRQYGSNHSINEFDLYYQDVQQRIKDQQYPNSDYPHKNKIDLTIVVDMLLTGFDSKYLNTLYVDKNLKYHGLIQAFSRTNRVLNDTKPYGNILDFRAQQKAVDEAVALFSGEDVNRSREIWLVDPAPKVIDQYARAVAAMDSFMAGQSGRGDSDEGVNRKMCQPQAVYNLKGDAARVEFIQRFKQVRRLKTQLDQYTDLDEAQRQQINSLLPEDNLRALRSAYLETAQRLKAQQGKFGENASEAQDDIEQLDFEFVLFSSALIDYDYIMGLIARFSWDEPGKHSMTRAQLISMLSAHSDLMDEREDIIAYINTLEAGKGLSEAAIRDGYQAFRVQKAQNELAGLAARHGLEHAPLQTFVSGILDRMIFDGEQLNELFAPLELGWKARSKAELALMEELVPFLNKQAGGREISGLAAYE
ncbi:MAG: type I restriction endonuclease subunit R, EcoR124 family [Parahaliea sp.]